MLFYGKVPEDPKDDEVSDYMVMRSNAGYYVGTVYYDKEMGTWAPNSRDSDYFDKKGAERYLELFKEAEENDEEVK